MVSGIPIMVHVEYESPQQKENVVVHKKVLQASRIFSRTLGSIDLRYGNKIYCTTNNDIPIHQCPKTFE